MDRVAEIDSAALSTPPGSDLDSDYDGEMDIMKSVSDSCCIRMEVVHLYNAKLPLGSNLFNHASPNRGVVDHAAWQPLTFHDGTLHGSSRGFRYIPAVRLINVVTLHCYCLPLSVLVSEICSSGFSTAPCACHHTSFGPLTFMTCISFEASGCPFYATYSKPTFDQYGLRGNSRISINCKDVQLSTCGRSLNGYLTSKNCLVVLHSLHTYDEFDR